MHVIEGKQSRPWDPSELQGIRDGYPLCHIDVGTGDGLFAYRFAREHSDTLSIGIDPVTDTFPKLASKARRKPAKGGAPNLLLVKGSLEELPGPLQGWATSVSVNFPWGSLLRALVEPAEVPLRALAALGRPGAEVVLLINVSIFGDEDYLRRLALPTFTEDAFAADLAPVYRRCGIHIEQIQALQGGVPHRTTWGQRLVKGSSRRTLMVRGTLEPEPAETEAP